MTYGWAGGSDRRWRRARAAKLQLTLCCERCARMGRITVASTVHHIKPLAEGGARLDPANLQAVCRPCHDALHGARLDGTDPCGLPLDPTHW